MTAAIDKLRQLDDDELDALIELAQARANSEMSKRDFLKSAGVLGTGAVLGGGAASELTGDAQAAASTTDGDGDIGTPANPEDVYADALAVFDGANNQIGKFDETGIETPSVDTENLNITGEVLVDADKAGGQTQSLTASNWVAITYNNENEDITEDFDPAAGTFTAPESGHYRWTIAPVLDIGADGDRIQVRIRNVTDGTNARNAPSISVGSADSQGFPFDLPVELSQGKDYRPQVRNLDSGDTVLASTANFLVIERMEEN